MDTAKSASQIISFVRGLAPRHQLLLAGSAVVVVGILWVFVGLVGGLEYQTLYTELPPGEANEIAQRLASQGVAYEISADATSVSVPTADVDRIRVQMASQGLPRAGRLGFELFDTPNWAGSDFAEQVNYQRALEGELERTILSIDEVESVRVHLVMPRESLFIDEDRGAKAAVVVKLSGNRLAEEAGYAITHLVSNAVDNLSPNEVTVIDADTGKPLVAPRSGPGQISQASDMERALTEKLIATLSPIVGTAGLSASVTVDYDLSSSEQTDEIYDPNLTVPVSTQQTDEQRGGTVLGGVPGTASNVPPATAAGAVNDTESEVFRTQNTVFAVSKTVRRTVDPPGRVRRIATAILIDDAVQIANQDGQVSEQRRKWTPEEMVQMRDLAMGAVGFDPERGDQLTIENVSFEIGPPIEAPPPMTGVDRVFLMVQQWRGPLRYLALALLFGVVYLLVLRPIKKQVLEAVSSAAANRELAAANQQNETFGQTGESQGLNAQQTLSAPSAQLGGLQQRLAEQVKSDPAGASRLIQDWMTKEEVKR